MILSMLPLLADLGEFAQITIESTGAPTGTNILGDVLFPATTSVPADAVTHVASSSMLERAELDHTVETQAFYTDQTLRTARDGNPPDVVVYDGRRWIIVHARDYSAHAGLYFALGSLASSP